MSDFTYQSSEELQRHNADVFASRVIEQQRQASATEKEKVVKVLDQYIARHGSTSAVRDMAKEHKRATEYQLDLSADLVEILTKIKSELR